ncbi:nucleotidyltransferase family protein [Parapedobacter deserti]|uniref:Nucleotidyltransferase family protein n=1 Tax=Parapedobacter deserti TaxID=1912957 RepID=A0ABV7JS47_9SPHI
MKLSKKEIQAITQYFIGLPVNKAYLFGSFARNEADADSDIDILVELDHDQPIGLRFFAFKDELSALLRRDVDLVSEESLSPYVKPFIERDKVLIYEKPVG